MPWTDQLKGDSVAWLLQHPSPDVRYRALRDLLDLPADDPRLAAAYDEARTSGPIAGLLDEMHPAGYWDHPGPGYNRKYRSNVWTLLLLAQLGASVEMDWRLRTACTYQLEQSLTQYGQFSMNGLPSETIDCLQGNLCWALTVMGVRDPRLAQAFEWMARTVTGEGLAPVGKRSNPLRYHTYKCGPLFACSANNYQPCAWGAVKVMMAFSVLPPEQRTPLIERAAQAGTDFLFSVDPVTAAYPTRLGDKPSRNWWKFGFPVFYVTDLLQLAEALIGLGFAQDPRLSGLLDYIRQKQDAEGRWLLEYDYNNRRTWLQFGQGKQPNPWVTLRALKVLKESMG